MSALPQPVRETIANWLRAGEIEVFIGYEAGSVPLRATPAFIRKPEEVGRLIWDATCENNLVAFLPKYKGKKVGLMVKGCDSRAVVGLMQEGQFIRENLRIVGVACPGVIDARRVAQQLALTVEDLDEASLDTHELTVDGTRLPLADTLFEQCRTCAQHTPTIADVTFGEPVADVVWPAPGTVDPFAAVHDMEALDDAQRWARFEQELQRCNLCYACRNACPLCYCTTCFVDRTQPRWTSQTHRAEDIQFYQIIRTFHLSGRCVGCGACSRACPQGVNLRLLLDKLRLDVQELYGYEAGSDPEVKPPLTTFREDDYNGFVK